MEKIRGSENNLIYGGAAKPHPIASLDPSCLLRPIRASDGRSRNGHEWDRMQTQLLTVLTQFEAKGAATRNGPFQLVVNSTGKLLPARLVIHRQTPNAM